MGLDITFRRKRKIVCPRCGELVDYHDMDEVDSGGRSWYPFLESVGYYVPNDDEDKWYGKDMILTAEQEHRAYEFARDEEVYNWNVVTGMIATALIEKDDIAINADW